MLNALLALPLLAALPSSLAATTCNGSPDLCSKLYSAVTFIGTHNSYAVGGNVADNQYKDVTAQLNDGVRTLQMQAHNAADGIHLCHGSCTFRDAGLIGTYLGKVASWVQANPNDGEYLSFRVATSCATVRCRWQRLGGAMYRWLRKGHIVIGRGLHKRMKALIGGV